MDLYRRIARLRNPAGCDRLRDEFKDRYGPLPAPVAALLEIQRLRILAGRAGIAEIRATRQGLDFFFAGGHEPPAAIIQGLMSAGPRGLQFKAVDQFILKVPAAREDHLAAAAVTLERVLGLQNKE
jgi:transcription-repair coupling factor (superfamily II helicase)